MDAGIGVWKKRQLRRAMFHVQ